MRQVSTGEVVAASDAMRDLRRQLIGRPLAELWAQLARAGIEAAERHRAPEDRAITERCLNEKCPRGGRPVDVIVDTGLEQ